MFKRFRFIIVKFQNTKHREKNKTTTEKKTDYL